MLRFRRSPAWGAILLVLCVCAFEPEVGYAQSADDAWIEIRADYRDGRFKTALARLEQLIAANAKDREAHYYMGLIYWRMGNLNAAAGAFRKVLALDPTGPFGEDARMWLNSNESNLIPKESSAPLAVATAAPTEPPPSPIASDLVPPDESPSPEPSPLLASPSLLATPTPRPHTTKPRAMVSRGPWLQVEPQESTRRSRGMNARKGYFKGADGTFEFIPPKDFALLDEGLDGTEWHALFGPLFTPNLSRATEQPPTLLIVWRELPELKRFHPDQRAARERQLLTIEAATYGPGAKLSAMYGVPCYLVNQRHGAWSALTRLFFKYDRLYALTYGGDASLLPTYKSLVDRSLNTPIFYP